MATESPTESGQPILPCEMLQSSSRRTVLVFIVFAAGVILTSGGAYFYRVHEGNRSYFDNNIFSEVALRKFPYPYKAALAISNDADNIESLDEFLEMHRFLNTQEMTSMGLGIGLEIGDSFLPYEPRSGAISYFYGGPEVAGTILLLIREGSIDVMHSYGKKPDFTRKDASATLQELHKNNCKLDVWVDHAKSTGNLGDDLTFGWGDHPDSTAYHADLTIAYGIRFTWLGRVTMIAGQSSPLGVKSFTGIYDSNHVIASIVNIAKEFSKNFLAVFGSRKYSLHERNDLVKIKNLDDGQKIYEFIRFDDYWLGVGTGATNQRLAYVISDNTLDRLKEAEGYMIVYTHFGKNSDCRQYICTETQNALRNLSEEFKRGNIYVTTTSKLLNYYINRKYLQWTHQSSGDDTFIHVVSIEDPISGPIEPTVNNLQGVTFYVPDKTKARIFIGKGKKELATIQRNSPDSSGRESITIPTIPFRAAFP